MMKRRIGSIMPRLGLLGATAVATAAPGRARSSTIGACGALSRVASNAENKANRSAAASELTINAKGLRGERSHAQALCIDG